MGKYLDDLTFLANFQVIVKNLPWTNTLAYFAASSVAVKKFCNTDIRSTDDCTTVMTDQVIISFHICQHFVMIEGCMIYF